MIGRTLVTVAPAALAAAIVLLSGAGGSPISAHPGDPLSCPDGFIYHPDSGHCEATTCIEGLTFNFQSLYCEVLPDGGPGDTSCDRQINAIDSALVLQHAAALVANLDCQSNGDLNASGSVDSIDATLILQFSAHMIDHFRL